MVITIKKLLIVLDHLNVKCEDAITNFPDYECLKKTESHFYRYRDDPYVDLPIRLKETGEIYELKIRETTDTDILKTPKLSCLRRPKRWKTLTI